MSNYDDETQLSITRIKTATHIDDDDMIVSVLAAHDYDVDQAISYLLHTQPQINHTNDTSSATTITNTVRRNDNYSQRNNNNNNNTTRTSTAITPNSTTLLQQQQQRTWSDIIPGLSYVYSTYQYVRQLLSYILPSWLIWSARTTTTQQQHSQSTESQWRTQFISRHSNLPNIHNGSYVSAVQYAKSQHKCLLVYLHSDTQSTECDLFIENILCNEAIYNFINENLILWCGNITYRDGHKLCNTLHVSNFPFIALLSTHLQNNQVGLLYRHTGSNIDVDTLLTHLLNGIEQSEHSRIQQQSQHSELEYSRSVLAEQDREYDDALKADIEAKNKKLQEQELIAKKQQEEYEIKLKRDQEQQAIQLKHQQHKQQLLDSLPVEPSPSTTTVLIAIKLPNNKQYKRRFDCNDKMITVFNYIGSLDETVVDQPYIVVSNFPRREYNDKHKNTTIKELNLGKQILLYVENIDDDSDLNDDSKQQ